MRHFILVTGATGFLGGATAAHLLATRASQELLFLVRADDAATGLARLGRSLARFDPPAGALAKLTVENVLCGDLARVEAFESDPRLDAVTEVVHCAAVASFSNHPGIRPVNVDGTFALARRLLRAPALRRFVHVGTAMACGPGRASPIDEDWDLGSATTHLVPYTASKVEIEQRLRAELPTLPLVVARPSIVIGHSRLGCAPSGSIYWLMRAVLALEHFTCSLDTPIDVVPVDYCAGALAHLALAPRLRWDLYHVSAGDGGCDTFRALDQAHAAAVGEAPMAPRYRITTHPTLAGTLKARLPELAGGDRRLLARGLKLYGGFAELGYRFSNARLRAEGVPAPPRFVHYLAACVASSQDVSLREQMLEDLK